MKREFVIFSPTEAKNSQGYGFWNNHLGWTNLGVATRYSLDERNQFGLPMSAGHDAQWIEVTETIMVKFTTIEWDTTDTTVANENLPPELTLALPWSVDLEADGADILTDKSGCCVKAFEFEYLLAPIHDSEHVENSGRKCPHCRSEDVVGGPVEIEAGVATQEMSCAVCGATWIDIYQLQGYKELLV